MASLAFDSVPHSIASRRTAAVSAGALAVGIAADLLLRDVRWGLGFPVFMALGVLTGALLWRVSGQPLARSAALWAVPLLLFASFFAWRDSETLRWLNGFAVFTALSMLLARIRPASERLADFAELALGWVSTVASALVDAWIFLISDIPWDEIGKRDSRGRLIVLARGLLLATPILVVFGLLLASADAVFSDTVSRLFRWDPNQVISHGAVILTGGWLAASLFRRLYLAPEPISSKEFWSMRLGEPPSAGSNALSASAPILSPIADSPMPYGSAPYRAGSQTAQPTPALPPQAPGIGNGEAAIALGSLILLLGAFAAIQLRFLFGEAVDLPAGVTASEYARRGFFELLAVCCLAVPTLRLVQYGLKRRGANGWTYPAMAGAVIGLLGIVVASAFRRLGLCVEAYGLTELRLYGGAAMAWIAGSLGWLLATLVMRRTTLFVSGALALGLASIVGLNALNPDAKIAKVNLDRAIAGKALDTRYLLNLSADAVPVMAGHLDRLSKAQAEKLRVGMADRRPSLESGDWRSWNVGRGALRH